MNPNPPTQTGNRKHPQRGFTLVELLVVIAIIAALASLLVVAIRAANVAANEAAIQTDCTQLAEGFTDYTNTISGGSYPPNMVNQPNALSELKRHLNKAFPSHREPDVVIAAIANLTPAEAVVFWLGGFSKDPQYPISGPGGPSFVAAQGEDFGARKGYDFEESRLGPRNSTGRFGGRTVTYPDPRGGPDRVINFWQYYPRNLTQPYIYFDTSRRPIIDPLFGSAAPIKTLKLNASGQAVANIQLANQGKCQVMSAGLDDAWGDLANLSNQGGNPLDWRNTTATYTGLLYPDGPWTGDMADNVVNFSTNRTLEDSQP